MKRKLFLSFSVMFWFVVATCSNLWAHYLTVNVDNYYPKVNEQVTISLGMGHSFPETVPCELDKMEQIYVVGPDGNKSSLEMKGEGEENIVTPIKISFDKPGTYLVVAERKKGFVSKTTDGYKYKSKKELENVITSYWSEGNAKAIITVESPSGEAYKNQLDCRYQLIPSNDPGKLQQGDNFLTQVMYDEAFHKTTVFATYEGFSAQSETFAYSTPSSEEEPAKIRMLSPGKWLVKIQDKFPYEKTEDADLYSFTSSLTFEIK